MQAHPLETLLAVVIPGGTRNETFQVIVGDNWWWLFFDQNALDHVITFALYLILLLVERKWDSKSLSGNLWSQEQRVSFQCNFRIIYLIKPLTAEIWSYVTLRLRCMKKDLLRKESAIKNCHNSFPKKYISSFKYIKRTEVSWEVYTLYVFGSQQDKKNFLSATLVLLYQVKLNIARQNGYA